MSSKLNRSFFLSVALLLSCFGCSSAPTNAVSVWDQTSFANVDAFKILPGLACSKIDQKQFMEGVVNSVQKQGTVHLYEAALSAKQLDQKNHAVILPLQFTTLLAQDNAPLLNIIHGSMKSLQECRVEANHREIYAETWSKDVYFEEKTSSEEVTQEALRAFDSFLFELMEKYRKVNPGKSPVFYIGKLP